ncbi:MAG: 2'-5' RNA ligase family protein [Sphingobacteriales bacterium]|nr:2'-5' RNA ligase family protein [Sphingobacteriales bacterium]
METITNTIPGYRVYEYLLALAPREELRDRISKLKEEFAGKYKTGDSGRGKPWVPLVRFTQYAMMEERILARLKTVAMGFPPFKTELKDFGSFPAHTIYIKVTSKLPVQQLVRTLRTEVQRLLKMNEEHKPYFFMEPHITIGSKLKPWQYEKGWLEYSRKHFTGRFIADGMILLRRPEGELKYQPLMRFEFQHLPVITRQGELFG